ncbi:hypothetical protein TRIP_B350423 [uncultured Desulfatiglans sp.]|nr:hypothetical protein TRIP_B350423 [uncultured Desulfatiglans sp.]
MIPSPPHFSLFLLQMKPKCDEAFGAVLTPLTDSSPSLQAAPPG